MSPNNTHNSQNELDALVSRVEELYDADLIVYFGTVDRKWDDLLIDKCKECKKAPQCRFHAHYSWG